MTYSKNMQGRAALRKILWPTLLCICINAFSLSVCPQSTPGRATVREVLITVDTLERSAKFEEAINACSDILKTVPGNEEVLQARAALYLKTKESDKAIADYSTLILLRPRAYGYWYNRALGHRQKRDFTEAINDLSRALSLNSKDERVLTTRASTYLDMDDLPNATEDIDRAVKEFGQTSKTSVAKSILCFKLFDTKCLLSASEQAMRADPIDGSAFNNHGYGLILKGDLDGAMKDLDQAERLAPSWSFPPNNKALVYILKQSWEQAAEQLEKARSASPMVGEIFLNQGLMDYGKGNLADALASFNKTIELSPRLASGYLNRARVRLQRQEYAEALDDVNTAFKLNPRSAESLFLRSRIESKLGRNPEAEKDREQAEKIRAEHPYAEIRIK
jgi:tetratricopeptide (TPR) repeat protein